MPNSSPNGFNSYLQLYSDFPVRLENSHVIGKNQIWVGVLGKCADGSVMSSSFKNRTQEYFV